MGTKRSVSESTFVGMLLHPSGTFKLLVGRRHDDVPVLPMIFAGIVGILLWADVFDLGRRYETGAILSGGLILGPLVGVAWLVLMALLGFWIGNILDRRHSVRFQYHILIPPFPLKNLLWIRVLGPEKIRRLFSRPGFVQLLKTWSWTVSLWNFFKESVSSVQIGYNVLLAGLATCGRLFVPLAIFVGMAACFLDQTGFGQAGMGNQWDGIFLILKCIFMGVFTYLWHQLLHVVFELDWARTVVTGTASMVLSLLTVLSLLAYLTGIQLL